jgi:hypothetical protein
MVKPGTPKRGMALLATMLAIALMTLLVVYFATTVSLGTAPHRIRRMN